MAARYAEVVFRGGHENPEFFQKAIMFRTERFFGERVAEVDPMHDLDPVRDYKMTTIHRMIIDQSTGEIVTYMREEDCAPGEAYPAEYFDLSGRSGHDRTRFVSRAALREGQSPMLLPLHLALVLDDCEKNHVASLEGVCSFMGFKSPQMATAWRYLFLRCSMPTEKSPGSLNGKEVIQFVDLNEEVPVENRALKFLPPLVQQYVSFGCLFSRLAVRDPLMGTQGSWVVYTKQVLADLPQRIRERQKRLLEQPILVRAT